MAGLRSQCYFEAYVRYRNFCYSLLPPSEYHLQEDTIRLDESHATDSMRPKVYTRRSSERSISHSVVNYGSESGLEDAEDKGLFSIFGSVEETGVP